MTQSQLITSIDIDEAYDKLYAKSQGLQARIDELMLEYCPDEMTPNQIANWEKRQKFVGDYHG